MFKYASGEQVLIGDIVQISEDEPLQKVSRIFVAGTPEAEGFLCESTGGMLLKPMQLLVTPEGSEWNDLVLVSRGPAQEDDPS